MNDQIRVDDTTIFNPSTGEIGTLPIIEVNVDKRIITDDSPIHVSWSIRDAHSAKLNDEDIQLQGSKEYISNRELRLLFTADNNIGTNEHELIIPIDTSPPVIHFFKCDSDFIIKGSPLTLSWNIDKAKKIEINNGVGNVTGKDSITVNVSSNSVYKLTAYSFFGSIAEAEVTFTLFPIPLVDGIFIPEPNFNFNFLNEIQPTFNLKNDLSLITRINRPDFTPLDDLGCTVYLNTSEITPTNNNSITKVLLDIKREVSRLINSLWRQHRS